MTPEIQTEYIKELLDVVEKFDSIPLGHRVLIAAGCVGGLTLKASKSESFPQNLSAALKALIQGAGGTGCEVAMVPMEEEEESPLN
jgi:hypothetical protein